MNIRVKQIRLALGMNQTQFGKTLGVGTSAVSKIEKGEVSVTPQIKKLLISTHNVNPTWLETGDGNMFCSEEVNAIKWVSNIAEDDTKQFQMKLISMLSHLTDDQWDNLRSFAGDLIEQQKNK